jgi:hypothetical protein
MFRSEIKGVESFDTFQSLESLAVYRASPCSCVVFSNLSRGNDCGKVLFW